MADTCVTHAFEIATEACKACDNSFCGECLVYAKGPEKPPFCIACALHAAGIRRSGRARNPRVRRKGFLGRRKVFVDDPADYERSFDDIDIELPAEATAATPTRTYRRTPSAELVEAVVAAEAAASETVPTSHEFSHSDTQISSAEGSLADWASSLGDTSENPARGGEPLQAAPWPDTDSTTWS